MSSIERDNIYDELVRVYAFSRVEHAQVEFRQLLESNDFLVINANYDELRPHGDGAAPGTPWGDESAVIYEKSLGFDIEGEFVSDHSSGDLVRLSQIIVKGYDQDAEEPDDPAFVLGMPRESL